MDKATQTLGDIDEYTIIIIDDDENVEDNIDNIV